MAPRSVSGKAPATTAQSALEALYDSDLRQRRTGTRASTSSSVSSSASSTDSLFASGSSLLTDSTSLHSSDDSSSPEATYKRLFGRTGTLNPPRFRHGSDAPTRSFDPEPNWIPNPSDPHCLRHAEFGHCDNPLYRYTSQWRGADADDMRAVELEPGYATFLFTYVSYLILIGARRRLERTEAERAQSSAMCATSSASAITGDSTRRSCRRMCVDWRSCSLAPARLTRAGAASCSALD